MRVIATGAVTHAARSVGRALSLAVVAATLLGTGGASRGAGSQEVQPPNRGGFTLSMGRPDTWRWYGGVSAAVHRRDVAQAAIYAHGGFYRDVLNPVTASLGVIAEGYFGGRGAFTRVVNAADGGVRVGLLSPTFRLGFGWEYSIRDGEADFFASLVHPLRRATDGVLDKQREVNGSLEALTATRRELGRSGHALEAVDLRTAAFVVAVGRVARVCLDRGIWP
jgi:hypothetical protein